MFVHIERGSSIPISRQILEQVRSQCLSGSLSAGERLPSVRELARQLAVNVNTVFRVYERLADEGLIELRHGDGTFVLPLRRKAGDQMAHQREKIGLEFDAVVQQAVLLGIPLASLRTRLNAIYTAAKTNQA